MESDLLALTLINVFGSFVYLSFELFLSLKAERAAADAAARMKNIHLAFM